MEENSLKEINKEYAALIKEYFHERAEYVRKIEDCPSLLQSIWMTEDEFTSQVKARAGYLLDAIHEGRIIYDEGFLKKVIQQLKMELEAQGVRRMGKVWIWPVRRSKGLA